ncbi:MAG: beta-glucosidase BglX [Alphaproteobacteria bacterium]|nr:beta-glucosidase BglX [Alphaproteobacteria bacterium]
MASTPLFAAEGRAGVPAPTKKNRWTQALAQIARKDSFAVKGEEAIIDALLPRMTLEEKLGQLTQVLGSMSEAGPSVPPGSEERIRAGLIGSFLSICGADYTRGLQKIAAEQSRLGIPLLFAFDVIHGLRTIFPVPLGEAASFDPAVARQTARAGAIEATAHGIHWTFAPMVDIARDPRWGRIVEGAGEDPYLGSCFAGARVGGFQGESLAAIDTLLATVKHFAAYGAAEGGRDYNTVDISQRTLHEIYLPPFRAALEAGAQSVMAAFNEIAGVPMHANQALIEGLLRRGWGFDGIVVSDYAGIPELMAHGVAGDRETAGILAFQAGIDVDMDGGVYVNDLPAAFRGNKFDEVALDDAVRRVLRTKVRLGLFADPYRYCNAARERSYTLMPQHRALARDAARKSFVLLKNDKQVLPFAKDIGTLAVIGPLADDHRAMLGSWIGAGQASDVITPLEAIRSRIGSGIRLTYANGVTIDGADDDGFAEAERIAREADAVLLFLGEDGDMTGEARSRSSLGLPGKQDALARTIQAIAIDKPLAVLLFAGRPLAIDWLAENVPAILLAWFPGVEAGPAIADVIFGDFSPAGRLPVTFPRAVGQVPLYYDHKPTGRPPQLDVTNTSKYIDVPWTPLFSFGHGLSYTTFAYGKLRLSSSKIRVGDRLRAEVTVANTGDRDGDEVVQLYLRDEVASVTRPVLQLCGFQRIHLKAGERRRVTFEIGPQDMSFYGHDLQPTLEPGMFTISVGGDSTDLIQAHFEVRA